MEELDLPPDLESPHHMDYEHLLDEVVRGDHELLELDTFLREEFALREAVE